jgi:hypothetical protein
VRTYRLFMPVLAIIAVACLFGVQGQFQSQNVTPSIAYSTTSSVAQPPLTYYPSCYYNQWGQYVCNNYPYYNIGNYYPWASLLNYYSSSNSLWNWGSYPGYWGYPWGSYPGYGGYYPWGSYPGYRGYYPGYGGYWGYYPWGYW